MSRSCLSVGDGFCVFVGPCGVPMYCNGCRTGGVVYPLSLGMFGPVRRSVYVARCAEDCDGYLAGEWLCDEWALESSSSTLTCLRVFRLPFPWDSICGSTGERPVLFSGEVKRMPAGDRPLVPYCGLLRA